MVEVNGAKNMTDMKKKSLNSLLVMSNVKVLPHKTHGGTRLMTQICNYDTDRGQKQQQHFDHFKHK